MKKSMRLVSLLLVAVFFASVIPFGAMATTTALKNKTVLAFGDSLTALGNPTYVGYLSDLLGIDVINAGVGGNMTPKGKERFQTDVLNKNPDVVLICFGMNDQACSLPSGQSWNSIEGFCSDMSYFITELQKRGCDVILITPNPVCDETGYYVPPADGTYTYNYEGSLGKFVKAMRGLADEYGCTLIDMHQEFMTVKKTNLATYKSYYASGDGIHQSQLGRQFWAEKVNAHLNAVYDNVDKKTITVKCVDENNNLLKTYNYVGANGANRAIEPPVLPAFSTDDSAAEVKFGTDNTVTFTYKSKIEPLLEAVENIDESKYSETALAFIRKEYNTAKSLLAADVIDFEALEKCAQALEYYLSAKGDDALVISLGKSYTRPDPNYYKWDSSTGSNSTELNELYADDFVRLTDGTKGTTPANSNAYSAWTSNADIIVDLGEAVTSNLYRAYFASGQWGVATPANLKVAYSNDKTNWTYIEKAFVANQLVSGGTDGWSATEYSVTADSDITARYIKFEITKTGNFVWIDEVEVAVKGATVEKFNLAYNRPYEKSPLFRQSNLTWDWDETFPEAYPDENGVTLTDGKNNSLNDLGDAAWVGFNGKTPILENNYNFIRVDLGDVYALDELVLHVGSNGLGYGITAPNVEFFVSEDGETYTSVGGANGKNDGQGSELLIVECDAKARYVEARITSVGWAFVSEIYAYGGAVSDEPVDPNPDDSSDPSEPSEPSESGDPSEPSESSEPSDPSEPSVPVDPSEPSESSDPSESFPPVDPSDSSDPSDPDDSSDPSQDPSDPSDPSDPVDPDPDDKDPVEPDAVTGDINGNGEIDSMDYVLLKRAYFGTYKLKDISIGDINGNGEIDSMDYVYLRRAYFGTYVIK